ncbi:MAG: methyltransferase domain-containing protein [Patulibacter minatonensis]
MTAVLSDRDVEQLSAACALDLTSFRRSHVEARVQRALLAARLDDVEDLRRRIIGDDDARTAFRRSVAISVTSMFRDPAQFEVLTDVLFDEPRPSRPIRAWSAGCSTGEEVWSLAAVLTRLGRAAAATVLGSDVLAENVRIARLLNPSTSELGGVRVPADAKLRFECRDVARQGAPGAGWDLVLCRNMAIYLSDEPRRAVHRTLARALRPGGILMLGRSERLGDPGSLGLERIRPHLYRRTA